MADEWFETVAEAQRRARRRLPRSVYLALLAGAERGRTLSDNQAAFAELGFAPHVLGGSGPARAGHPVLGQDVSMPVLISPTGVQAVHPDGEVAVARAAAARGTAMGLSSFASKPVEDVVAANPKTFFQVYWSGSRDRILAAGRAGPGRRRRRADRHHGLVLLARAGLGQPDDPAADRPADHGAARPGGDRPAPLAGPVRAGRRAAGPRPCRTWPCPARTRRRSSTRTASGCRPRRRAGTTWPGCASSGAGRSCSRA